VTNTQPRPRLKMPIQVTASADMYHLSNSAVFRRAVSEVEAQQSARAASITGPAGAGSAQIQPEDRSTDSPVTILPDTVQTTLTSRTLAPPAIAPSVPMPFDHSTSDEQPGAGTILLPANMLDLPTLEESTRMADEMSNYLTWGTGTTDLDGLPPWINFDAT
jgi:hypothetical protein